MEEKITRKNSYLSFTLKDEIFVVPVKRVIEILEMQKITRVPKTSIEIKGITNFRGEILPIIDLRVKFNMSAIENFTEENVIIVFDLKFEKKRVIIGALVDSVNDVIDIDDNEIKDIPELGAKYNSDYIYGMIKINDIFAMIVEIDKIFNLNNINQIILDEEENIETISVDEK